MTQSGRSSIQALIRNLRANRPLRRPSIEGVFTINRKRCGVLLLTSCAVAVFCGACDPVYLIRRDFTASDPIDPTCIAAAIDELKTAEPIRNINVIPTPLVGVEEVIVRSEHGQVSFIVTNDNRELRLEYIATGYISKTGIEATKALMLDVENRMRASCPAADGMILTLEICTRMNCPTP